MENMHSLNAECADLALTHLKKSKILIPVTKENLNKNDLMCSQEFLKFSVEEQSFNFVLELVFVEKIDDETFTVCNNNGTKTIYSFNTLKNIKKHDSMEQDLFLSRNKKEIEVFENRVSQIKNLLTLKKLINFSIDGNLSMNCIAYSCENVADTLNKLERNEKKFQKK